MRRLPAPATLRTGRDAPSRTLWRWYLALAVLTVLPLSASRESWAVWGHSLVHLSTPVAIVIGILRLRPARPLFWWLLAAGQLCYSLALTNWRIRIDGWEHDVPFRSADDLVLIAGTSLLALALAAGPQLYASLRRQLTGAVDGLIIVLGVSSATWSFVARPYLSAVQADGIGTAIFFTYQTIDILRFGLAARIMLSGHAATPAIRLALTGTVVQLTGDTVYGMGMSTPGNPDFGWQSLIWVIGSFITSAGALHPSAAEQPRRDRDDTGLSRTRLALFLVLTMMSPVLTGIYALLGRSRAMSGGFSAGLDAIVPMVLGVGTAVALIARLSMLAGVAHRRAAALKQALKEQEALRDELAHRATHDPLTGLANRVLLIERLAAPESGGALLLIDLDGFKGVNDSYGHPAGDELLVAVAQRMSDIVRPDDTVARLGGDEFAILLPAVGEQAAAAVAARTVQVLGEPYPLRDDRTARITSSVGHLHIEAGTDPSEALRQADLALYKAKTSGKNQVVRYHAGLHHAGLRVAHLSHSGISGQDLFPKP